MFMLIAGGRGKEKRGKKRALLDCPFPLLCFLHRLCSSYLLKIKCVLKFRTLFISSKTWFSFQRKDKHEKFGVVSVLQGLETACSLEISVPQEQTFNCSENSQASETFTGMHDAMIENFRLISGLQKQLEKHMSNCSWRVFAKFEADAMEFRLFWMFLRKKIYWSHASVQIYHTFRVAKDKGEPRTMWINTPCVQGLILLMSKVLENCHWFPWVFAGLWAHI